MTREARTGLACLGVVVLAVAFVGLIFIAGIAAQPKPVLAQSEESQEVIK